MQAQFESLHNSDFFSLKKDASQDGSCIYFQGNNTVSVKMTGPYDNHNKEPKLNLQVYIQSKQNIPEVSLTDKTEES